MKSVFRVREWRIEESNAGPRVAAMCSMPMAERTLAKLLRGAFRGLLPIPQAIWGIAGLTGETRIVLRGQVPDQKELSSFLELLCSLLTVCDDADACHCLAIYRVPSDDIPNDDWPFTELGRLVHGAKYSRRMSDANDIAKEMMLVIAQHPGLRGANAIAAMPSSGQHFDAPATWRTALARQFGFEELLVTRVRAVQPQKEISDREEKVRNQKYSMSCGTAAGKSVIVLDDLYMDGATMDEAIRALRAGGARCVLGLSAVKTARGTQGGVSGLIMEEE